MASALEKLTFTVLLLDKLSSPAQGVCRSFDKIQERGRSAFQTIGKGGAAVTASALALTSLTGPAREFKRALGDVSSLNVPQEELDKLGAASKKYVAQFGGNAAEIVRSGYDIQSAIPGLSNGALAAFTVNSSMLAKATRANAGDMTNYMGTMYNIFSRNAEKIGQARWVEELTGKTAYAVRMFKTTGPAMKQAFEGVGSTAQQMGIDMNEQIAVLGTLQGSMGAAQAGTAYKGFVSKLAQGQNVLGVSFKGADGELLPIYQIVEKIRGSIGRLDKDQQVARLNQAFGETGAMAVLNMLDKTEQLKGSIKDLSAITGNGIALEMANERTDPLERFNGVLGVIRVTLGQTLLPVVNAFLSVMAKGLIAIQWLLDNVPPLRWIIGAVVLAVTGLTAAWGAFMVVSGVVSMLRVIRSELRMAWAWCLKNSAATHSMTAAQRINAVARMLWAKSFGRVTNLARLCTWQNIRLTGVLIWQKTVMVAQKVGAMIYAGALFLINGALLPVIASVWAFTVALLACPVTWIVVGIVALIAALVALVVYWDEVKIAAVACWDWIVGAAAWCWDMLTAGVSAYWNFWSGVWSAIGSGAAAVFGWIGGLWDGMLTVVGAGVDYLLEGAQGYLDFWLGVWGTVGDGAASVFDWIAKMWDNSVGLIGKAWDWITGGSEEKTAGIREKEPVLASAAAHRRGSDVAAGGIRSSTTNNSTNYGGITINTTAFPGPGELEDYMALQG